MGGDGKKEVAFGLWGCVEFIMMVRHPIGNV